MSKVPPYIAGVLDRARKDVNTAKSVIQNDDEIDTAILYLTSAIRTLESVRSKLQALTAQNNSV